MAVSAPRLRAVALAVALVLGHAAPDDTAHAGGDCAAGGCEDSRGEAGDGASLMQIKRPSEAADPDAAGFGTAGVIAKLLRGIEEWLPHTSPEDAQLLKSVGVDCHLTKAEDRGCPLTDMNTANIYHIYPGGQSSCLDKSTPYFFEVKPGDEEKLLFYFQEGGACWDKVSYHLGLCTNSTQPDSWNGLLNFTDSRNPYRGYTMVKVLYCSGDMHAGDTEQPWGEGGEMLQIRGYRNAGAALDWALANFPKLTELRLLGTSAGSLGLQWWARRALSSFKARGARTLTIPDSFAGVLFPPRNVQDSESFLFRTWNMCGDDTLTASEQERCRSGKLLLSDVFAETMRAHPESRFGMINAKADLVQRLFEKFMELTGQHNVIGFAMTAAQFYKTMNLMMQKYAKEPNFQTYLIDGDHHCYTNSQIVFQTTPLGKDGKLGGRPKLIDWIECLSETPCREKRVVCIGELQRVAPHEPAPHGCYCDVKLAMLK